MFQVLRTDEFDTWLHGLRDIARALGDIARARGMMQLAKDTGLTREGLYKALGEQGNPSFSTVMKVMRALGLQISVNPQGARA